jgi:hypothetical protein
MIDLVRTHPMKPEELLLLASNLQDAIEDALPSEDAPEHALYGVAVAHVSDAVDALRVLAGHVDLASFNEADDPDWDAMPADVVEAARSLVPPPPVILGSSTSSSTSSSSGEG